MDTKFPTNMEFKMAEVGDDISKKRGGWSFDDQVANAFDEHVAKSVPGYSEGHDIVAGLADFLFPISQSFMRLVARQEHSSAKSHLDARVKIM